MLNNPELSKEFVKHICKPCADNINLKPVMVLYQFTKACDLCKNDTWVSHIMDYGRPKIKFK